MKLKSENLLNIIETGLIRKITEFLAERILEYENNFENLGEYEKEQQSQMILHYNEAVEIYNSCSAIKIEKIKLPKSESWK